MKKNSVKINYIYNMLYQVLAIVIPIITTPYLARTLGAKGTGIYGYTISIVTYFILFGSLGISLYGQREIAYYQNDKKSRSEIFFELITIRLFTMFISAIIFYCFFGRIGEYSLYYRILLFEMLANVFDISWFFQGLEEFKKIVIRNLIIKVISVVSIFMFIKGPNDVAKYLMIYSFSTLFGSITLWFGLKKYVIKPQKINLKRHILTIISLFIPQVAAQVYTVLDKTMIGVILNDMNEVGYYEQSQKIIKIILTIITSVGIVMMPRIASCFAKGNKEQIQKYMYKTFNFVFMMSFPLMFGIIAISNKFVPIFFGNGYEKVPLIMNILSVIILFISLSNIIGTQYLLPVKKQKEFTISVVGGAVVNFIFNLILINNLKSYGAAIATVLAELAVTSLQFYYIRKDFNLLFILKKSVKYLLNSLIMFAICLILNKFINNSIICIITQIFLGIVIYFGLLLLMKDELINSLYNNILKNVKLKNNLYKDR